MFDEIDISSSEDECDNETSSDEWWWFVGRENVKQMKPKIQRFLLNINNELHSTEFIYIHTYFYT